MLCRYYRWRIDRQLDDEGTKGDTALKRHMDHCRQCSQYAKQLEGIGRKLSRPAVDLPETFVQPLAAKVIASVFEGNSLAPGRYPITAHTAHVKFFAGAMAASLLITACLLMLDMRRESNFERAISPLSLGAQTLQTPLPVVAAWSEKPIRTEVEKLRSDTTNAILFLINCTPGRPELLADED